MAIMIGNKKLEDLMNDLTKQVHGIPFSNNEDIKEDCAMTGDEQLKRLKAFANGVLGMSHTGQFINGDIVDSTAEKYGLTINGRNADWLYERAFYRVALYQNDINEFYTVTADDKRDEQKIEVNKQFIKWLTDWQEYEV